MAQQQESGGGSGGGGGSFGAGSGDSSTTNKTGDKNSGNLDGGGSGSSIKSGDAKSGNASGGSGSYSGNSLAASMAADFGDRSGINMGPQQWNMGIFAKANVPSFPFGGADEGVFTQKNILMAAVVAALAVACVIAIRGK